MMMMCRFITLLLLLQLNSVTLTDAADITFHQG